MRSKTFKRLAWTWMRLVQHWQGRLRLQDKCTAGPPPVNEDATADCCSIIGSSATKTE